MIARLFRMTDTRSGGFELPSAPATCTGAVKAWSQPVTITTYLPDAPDKNPMFLEKRVYQGSSGKIYPLPFYNRIASEKVDHEWQAIHIENEYLRLMILPQIGGRIHVAMDKTNGYDFIYRQNVIKPALVGLAGPWISGGIEFNWPQHHRPGTFMPADWHIKNHEDGSVTVWLSEHDPLSRMKGMHGVCLHPGKSYIELKARLFNRTPITQTFLWWANVATRVHEKYQSFFPPDVSYVADHAKRAMSTYPRCEGHYYGVDYAARAERGTPASELPSQFRPTRDYAPNDLGWYANIPVPTSYMCMGSQEDFFGGYDHAARAGIVHVADHHISPGKKQWTWGNHEFGYAWDRLLTDSDGPYIELMAGVFTDNQPDFSFLAPGETRTFSQYWYPIREIGAANHANIDCAVNFQVARGLARVHVATTSAHEQLEIEITQTTGRSLKKWVADVSPATPFLETLPINKRLNATSLVLEVRTAERVLLRYAPKDLEPTEVPVPATEPAAPSEIGSNDELYVTGLHLAQYRHATRPPELYWQEALRRDPGDARCNVALGNHHLNRGEFAIAENFFRKTLERITLRNPNPADGEALYGLGLALRYQNRFDEAYAAFSKACWNAAWQAPAHFALAQIDSMNHRWTSALDHLDKCLRRDTDHLHARNLKAIVLRRLRKLDQAGAWLKQTLALDPLDFWATHIAGNPLNCDTQARFDLALDYANAGLFDEALLLLQDSTPADSPGSEPMLHYYRAYLAHRSGRDPQADLQAAANATPDYCFPARLEEIAILQFAIDANPSDSKAPYYLGNLYYDRRRYEEAIACWERSVAIDTNFAIPWRNLGIARFNVQNDVTGALTAYENALKAEPNDSRLFYERDQLWKQVKKSPHLRLAELAKHRPLVDQRDDLTIEYCALLNHAGRHEEARHILDSRKFQPWEGGEGQALGQHTRTYLALGRQALERDEPEAALELFQTALSAPHHLGEARHLLANCSDIHYWLGVASSELNDHAAAQSHWQQAADFKGDFQDMSVRAFSEMTYFSALSMQKLGRHKQAEKLLNQLLKYAQELEQTPAKIDYFATSLPTMLLFHDDLQLRQTIHAKIMQAQAFQGLGKHANARRLVEAVLADDPVNAFAKDLVTHADFAAA